MGKKLLTSLILVLAFMQIAFSQERGGKFQILEYSPAAGQDGPIVQVEVSWRQVKHEVWFSFRSPKIWGYRYQGKVYKQITGIKNLKDIQNLTNQDYLPIALTNDAVSAVDVEYTLNYKGDRRTVKTGIYASNCFGQQPDRYCKKHIGVEYFGMGYPTSKSHPEFEYYKHVNVSGMKLVGVSWSGHYEVKRLIREMLKSQNEGNSSANNNPYGYNTSGSSSYNSQTNNGSSTSGNANNYNSNSGTRPNNNTSGYNSSGSSSSNSQTNNGSSTSGNTNNYGGNSGMTPQEQQARRMQQLEQQRAAAQAGNSNRAETPLERQNRIARQHEDHVRKNNEAAAARKSARAQEEAKARASAAARRQAEYDRKMKEAQAKKEAWQAEQDAFWERQEAERRRKEQEWRRFEFHSRQNATILANYVIQSSNMKVDISQISAATNPQEVIRNLNSVKRQIDQKKANIDRALVNTFNTLSLNAPTTKAEANQNLGVAVIAAGAAIGQHAAANKEKKEAEAKAKRMLNNFRAELDGAYAEAMNASLKQATYSKEQAVETFALQQYFYYKCLKTDMNSRFNYSNANWANPSSNCNEPQKSASRYADNSSNLDVAKRKMKLFKEYKYEPFKKVAMSYAQISINKNEDKIDALVFRAENNDDIVERYGELLYAKSLGGSFNHGDLLASTKKDFDKVFYNAIDQQDLNFLERALSRSLYASENRKGETPLEYAAVNNKPQALEKLLQHTPDAKKSRKMSLMLRAAENNALDVVKSLKSQGVPYLDADYPGESPVEMAFYNDAKQTFAYLMEEGENVNHISNRINNKEAFDYQLSKMLVDAALINNNPEMIETAEQFVDFSEADYMEFIKQALSGSASLSPEVLLENVENKSLSDAKGNTLVHYAIMNNDAELLQSLLSKGFYSDLRNVEGKLPAEYLLELDAEKSSIIQNINRFNLNLNFETTSGVPFIHEALHRHRAYLPKYLSVEGTNPNVTGLYGWSALHYCARQGDLGNTYALIRAGANKYIEDDWGRTPFQVARERVGSTKSRKKRVDYITKQKYGLTAFSGNKVQSDIFYRMTRDVLKDPLKERFQNFDFKKYSEKYKVWREYY